MVARLYVLHEKCVGCEACSLACSFEKTEKFNRHTARIQVENLWDEGIALPNVCVQCERPACVLVCPVKPKKAITKHKDGIIRIDPELCTGCKLCMRACPYDAIFLPKGEKIPIKCDLCDGEPACVSSCIPGALIYKEVDDELREKLTKKVKIFTLRGKRSEKEPEVLSWWGNPKYDDINV
ncbi:MAG: 4Fe-4S dicluster domain-containing protein [Candidatus Ranarchaeia archaeon]